MTESEKYLFDVHGYIVIRDALSQERLAAANWAVDHYADNIQNRPTDLANQSSTLAGDKGRGDMGTLLTWKKPYCDVFREMMVHPAFGVRSTPRGGSW